jgi:S1-C subfamily serine protease
VGGAWTTVYLASEPETLDHLDLIAASIAPGAAPTWELPSTGRVSGLIDATVDLLHAVAGRLPEAAPAAGPAVETPSATQSSTGTGFFVGDRVLVTAGHVVGGCDRVALADGTELRRLGSDAALDVAAFASPAPARAWFGLSRIARARLGQRVHAAGFPYYSIVGTALHLTGGNVSALTGVNDDARFFSFTAPVQPGNSGGPLIDGEGRVMGLVVSRLSEHYIVEETGSLPQNMNYALGSAELAAFLQRIDAPLNDGGLGSFDMDAGAPEGFEQAVVPVICLAGAMHAGQ